MSDNICLTCGKRFADYNGLKSHARAKKHRFTPTPVFKDDDEPSISDLMVEASWNDAPELDWVREMMP